MVFRRKRIGAKNSLGKLLKTAREAKGVSIRLISECTKIPEKYIISLERGDYKKLPEEPYLQCILKCYCQSLKLDCEEFLSLYNKEKVVTANQPDFRKPVRKLSRFNFFVAPKIIRNAVIALALIICLTYLGNKIQAVVRPPELIIETPSVDLVTKENTIRVAGITEYDAQIIINEQKIIVNDEGSFSAQVFLQPGINTIKIVAKKKHSAEIVEYRRVVAE